MPTIRTSWTISENDITLITLYRGAESIHGPGNIGGEIRNFNIQSDPQYFGPTPVNYWDDNVSDPDIYTYSVEVRDAWGNTTMSDPVVVDGTAPPLKAVVTATVLV